MISVDYLIIGSGAAGLTFAVKLADKFPERSVCVITKSREDESNTKYAQGGIATVLDGEEDSFQKHIHDTLKAGDGHCDREVVEMVVREGPKRLKELIALGAEFDQGINGKLDLAKEGGHSASRIIHRRDRTGLEIEKTLLTAVSAHPNIMVLKHHFALEIITEHQAFSTGSNDSSCYGAYILDRKKRTITAYLARATYLATGGIGMVYGTTTNPTIATGDGIAMAYRANARIRDMEFIQFHPTALYTGKEGHAFLISEAVRGFGAYLRNRNGHRFMLEYDERAELASRDIVSRGIESELRKSGDRSVFLDCTHLDMEDFKKRFPTIYQECLKLQIDIESDWIPVVPVSHYLCGGIEVDMHGRTSVKNLFAGGECTSTGLHGANRLASNSLLEALVYAHNSFSYLLEHTEKAVSLSIPTKFIGKTTKPVDLWFINHKKKSLQQLMKRYAGIVRTTQGLKEAIRQLQFLYDDVEGYYRDSQLTVATCELRNMIIVARLIVEQSLIRKVNRGGYYNTDLLIQNN